MNYIVNFYAKFIYKIYFCNKFQWSCKNIQIDINKKHLIIIYLGLTHKPHKTQTPEHRTLKKANPKNDKKEPSTSD